MRAQCDATRGSAVNVDDSRAERGRCSFEIASHETLGGEIEAGGDLFDAQIGVAQQILDLHHHQHGNPLPNGAATHVFDEL